ncbi:hypothetical protein BH23ACT6_BH23ACT6_10880 [soil metagenome]
MGITSGFDLTAETNQSDLSRLSGVPQSKISRYVIGHLEPSGPVLERMLFAMGVEPVNIIFTEVDRNKLLLGRWDAIVDDRDEQQLRAVLIDPTEDGVSMREVSPMSGFLPEEQRLRVLIVEDLPANGVLKPKVSGCLCARW